jgi:hypothetical protein
MLGMMGLHGLIDMEKLVEISDMDRMEAELANLPQANFPLEHFFPPGLYVRKIFMPANTFVVSMKHKTMHPFFILKGKVAVLKESENGGFETESLYEGGDMGITKPNTKRFLFNIEDTIWATCHSNPNDIEDPDEIGLNIVERTDNPLIDSNSPQFNQWRKNISPSLIHTTKEFELPCAS